MWVNKHFLGSKTALSVNILTVSVFTPAKLMAKSSIAKIAYRKYLCWNQLPRKKRILSWYFKYEKSGQINFELITNNWIINNNYYIPMNFNTFYTRLFLKCRYFKFLYHCLKIYIKKLEKSYKKKFIIHTNP
jgi:hypothetical protein